jgi:type I restriction enzyme S subunit
MKEGWEIKKLSEIGNVFNGNSINAKVKKERYAGLDGGLPYIGTKDVGFDSIIDYENGVKIPFSEMEQFKTAPPNTPLICAEGGSAGRKIGFTNQEVCFGNKLFALVPNKNVDSRFLFYYYFSSSFREHFSTEMAGIIGGVSMNKFKSIEIPVPPLREQQRIVSILDRAFAAIDKAKANAEQNLQNAKELFDCVLDSILYDKRWEVRQLGEVCEKVEYGTSSKAQSQGKLPVMRMGNIQNGRFNWESLVFSDNEIDNEKYLLKYNDVLFNRTNSPELVGKTAIYKGERPAIFAGYLIRVHRKEDLLDADYLNYFLNSKMAFEYGQTVVTSSVNQANINGTKLKSYPIPLPSLNEQQAIVRQLDALRTETQKLEAVYQKKMDDLEELKKSILQKAFAGELETEKAIAL